MPDFPLPVVRLPHADGLDLPHYATPDSAGMDLRAAVADDSPITLAPMERALVPTGLQMAIPRGYEVQIRPRSGLAYKHGVTVLNSPGTIDADYRGEIGVLLVNLSKETFTVQRGERIAQMVIAAHATARVEEVTALGDTDRGAGGFGSTGTR
jgi:dUTP pyrophosphatase